jgi:hypothetical protein
MMFSGPWPICNILWSDQTTKSCPSIGIHFAFNDFSTGCHPSRFWLIKSAEYKRMEEDKEYESGIGI